MRETRRGEKKDVETEISRYLRESICLVSLFLQQASWVPMRLVETEVSESGPNQRPAAAADRKL